METGRKNSCKFDWAEQNLSGQRFENFLAFFPLFCQIKIFCSCFNEYYKNNMQILKLVLDETENKKVKSNHVLTVMSSRPEIAFRQVTILPSLNLMWHKYSD